MPEPPNSASLADQLAESLPENSKFRIYHVSTPPTKCPAIFSAPQGAKPERTFCESHFLSVSICPTKALRSEEEILVLAIEVLIYTTRHLTTIFVSKADSTGYLSLLDIPKGHNSPLRAIPTTFITYLVRERQRPGVRLVVSLFARASDQYLFPGSVQNSAKHISDDRQLVKWWCRVLDPLLQASPGEDASYDIDMDEHKEEITSQAYILVPGEDSILSFLPQITRTNPMLRKRWKRGHPLLGITRNPTAPPRCLIPHFPDDPKARYLNELDDEIPDSNTNSVNESPTKRGSGQWKSVKTLEQFWEMMGFRQECSSGRLVGFIWVVFTPPDIYGAQIGGETGESQESSILQPSTPPRKQANLDLDSAPSLLLKSSPRKTAYQRRKKLTGPIIPRLPRIKSSSSTLSSTHSQAQSSQPTESPYYVWPTSSRGEVVLDEKRYSKASETLLRLDFANRDVAEDSTRTWIEEVRVLAGLTDSWGQEVTGRHQLLPSAAQESNSATTTMLVTKKRKADTGVDPPTEVVNALGVRKKPKAAVEQADTTAENGVNTLGAGFVRKKPKIQPEPIQVAGPATGINVMSGGLVRKKPKAA